MKRIGILIAFALLASPVVLASQAEGQIVVTGARKPVKATATVVAAPPTCRPAPDRGANVRSVRRERNPYFAARPVYPSPPVGARASINFEPFTSKYYPTENENYPPQRVCPTTSGR